MAETSNIDRIDAPSPEEFERRYRAPGRPVVISGVVDKWPAASLWNPDFLLSSVGKNLVPVSFMSTTGDYAGAVRKKLPLADYIEALAKDGEEAAERVYLGEVSLEKFFPQLMEHVERPRFVRRESPLNAVLYFGKKQFSQLHYHPLGSATLCQVYGRKRVWLYPPDQTRYLYKYPWYSSNNNMSLTTSPAPDPERFPDFSRAKGIELVVEAGQMLFIPIYWWHAVQNEEMNIAAVFFWYRTAKSRWLPPSGMRANYFLEIDRKLVARARRAVLGR